MKTSLTSILKAGVIALVSFSAVSSTHAVLINSFSAAASTGNFSMLDTVGTRTLIGRNATGTATAQVLGNATTTMTNFTKAFTASATDVGFYTAPFALQTYTFEIWTRMPGGTNPSTNAVIFESGGGANGFGIFARSGGTLQFASYSGNGTNNNEISLATSTLNTSDYLQVVGVYNTSNNVLTFQIKDVDGVTLSGTDSSGTLGTGTGNAAGLFISGLDTTNNTVNRFLGNAGGSFATGLDTTLAVDAYTGQVALFNIYDNDAIASGAVLSSFNAVVIPEPSTWALLAGSLTVLVLLRRRRGTC
jgi:hypothetical protein